MPGTISHYLLARCTLLPLQKENYDICEAAYYYGAQGPDLMFFHRAAPWQFGRSLRHLGSSIHKSDPDLPLNLMRKYWVKSGCDGEILSYILGYMTHYSLDRTAHPYIYALQDRMIREENIKYRPFFVHNRIESALDVILLRNEAEIMPPDYNPATVLKADHSLLKKLADFLGDVFGEIFPGKVKSDDFLYAFRDLRSNLSLLHDVTGFKRKFMRTLESIFRTGPVVSALILPVREDCDWDYANLSKSIWRNPSDPVHVRSESYLQLFDMAKTDVLGLIQGFMSLPEDGSMRDITGGLGYNTGAPISAAAESNPERVPTRR